MSQLYITKTTVPPVCNCTRCDNLLLGQTTTRVQKRIKGAKRWPTQAWLCEGCAHTLGYDRPTTL